MRGGKNSTVSLKSMPNERVWVGIRSFIAYLDTVPGRRDWQRQRINYTLNFDDPIARSVGLCKEFSFPPDIERAHKVIMAFLSLSDSVESLKEVEFYFRRYPFRGLPVTRHRHIVFLSIL